MENYVREKTITINISNDEEDKINIIGQADFIRQGTQLYIDNI